MTFDAAGNLIEVDDAGIYRRTNPRSNTGDWFSMIGNLQATEMHDVAYDPISNIIMSGNQDTGTMQQIATGSFEWYSVSTADGGDVAVSVDPPTRNQSVRYSSFQGLGRSSAVRTTRQQPGQCDLPRSERFRLRHAVYYACRGQRGRPQADRDRWIFPNVRVA